MAPGVVPCAATAAPSPSAFATRYLGFPDASRQVRAPQAAFGPRRGESLASPMAVQASPRRLHPLGSRGQEVFIGCADQHTLLPLPFPAGKPSSPSSPRGGCASASMSFSRGDSYLTGEFIEAHVIQAVRMVPLRRHLYMTMADGSEVEVEHVNPSAGRLLYLNSMPTIFLRMADSTNLLLPIVVGDVAINFLMKAFGRESNPRPDQYELMNEIAGALLSEVKHVKITHREGDTYHARIFFPKPGSPGLVSVDARPSDAIILAVRAQVPIYVSRAIIHNDCVRVVYDPAKHGPAQPRKMDTGASGHDDAAEEIHLIKCMQDAAMEERYADAARLRDQLAALRAKTGGKTRLNKF